MSRAFAPLAALLAVIAVPGSAADWTHEGPGGPSQWGGVCVSGKEQSPVDLRTATPAPLGDIVFHYQPLPASVRNTGHTLSVTAGAGNGIEIEGEHFDLAWIEFHHPSEHALNGKKAPIEVQLVHKNPAGTALVTLAVMIVPGAANPAIEAIWGLPADFELDPMSLLPFHRTYLRYEGSLTAPPCSETVRWLVLDQPVEASQGQIDRFAKLFPMNARPLQPLNQRVPQAKAM